MRPFLKPGVFAFLKYTYMRLKLNTRIYSSNTYRNDTKGSLRLFDLNMIQFYNLDKSRGLKVEI